MAAPRNGFGARQRDPFLPRYFFDLLQDALKFNCQHEIGVGPKGPDFPSGVRRVRRGFAKTAEISAPKVFHPDRRQRLAECLPVKMRKTSRRRPASHVDYQFNRMRFQQRHEIITASRRVADRMDRSKTVAIHSSQASRLGLTWFKTFKSQRKPLLPVKFLTAV